MATDIKELISKCKTCIEVKENRRKEPLMTHEIPDRAWSKLALVLISLQDKNYLVTVDYYSNYWEVDPLHSTATVIKKLKKHFARWGMKLSLIMGPSLLVSSLQGLPRNGIFATSPARPITANPMEKLNQQ